MSDLEENLLGQIRMLGLPMPEREVHFWPKRRHRFDFAYPDKMLAIECEGGTRRAGGSRHNKHAGFEEDCRKYSEAAIRGWRLIRCTTDMVTNGECVTLVERALSGEG